MDSKYYLLQFDHAQTAQQMADSDCRHSSGAGYNYAGCVSARHLETVNTLFVDGHVKAMKPQTIIGNENVATWRYWTTNSD